MYIFSWLKLVLGDQPTDIDTQPGDIIFTLKTAPHARFTRRGNDLYMTHAITLLEALTGFKKSFKVLTLRRARSSVLPGVTSPLVCACSTSTDTCSACSGRA